MTYSFRIAPKNALIIEWQAHLPGAARGFYRVCDSPADAKRSLNAIRGHEPDAATQGELEFATA